MEETWVWSLGKEDPLEKEMAMHASTLAREIIDRVAWQAPIPGDAKELEQELATKQQQQEFIYTGK